MSYEFPSGRNFEQEYPGFKLRFGNEINNYQYYKEKLGKIILLLEQRMDKEKLKRLNINFYFMGPDEVDRFGVHVNISEGTYENVAARIESLIDKVPAGISETSEVSLDIPSLRREPSSEKLMSISDILEAWESEYNVSFQTELKQKDMDTNHTKLDEVFSSLLKKKGEGRKINIQLFRDGDTEFLNNIIIINVNDPAELIGRLVLEHSG